MDIDFDLKLQKIGQLSASISDHTRTLNHPIGEEPRTVVMHSIAGLNLLRAQLLEELERLSV